MDHFTAEADAVKLLLAGGIGALLVGCSGDGGSHANAASVGSTWRGFVKTVNAQYRASGAERARLASRAVTYLSAAGCRFVIADEQVAITSPRRGPCDEAVSYETALDGYQPSIRNVRVSGNIARAVTKGGAVEFEKQDGKWLISRFPTVGD
jgi:hypothetical protein